MQKTTLQESANGATNPFLYSLDSPPANIKQPNPQVEANKQAKWNSRFPNYGLVGGCEGLPFTDENAQAICRRFSQSGWSALEIAKALPYLNANGEEYFLDSKQVNPLSKYLNVNLLPAEFRKALEENTTALPCPPCASAAQASNFPTLPTPTKDNTLWYVGIGVCVLLFSVLLGFIFKKATN